MKETIAKKAARLQKVTHLLYRNPRGLTSQELARHCGVNVRTIQRDLKDLEQADVPIWDDERNGRHGIVSGYFLPPIHFSLQEAGALYLAARLLARYSDEQNPVVVDALAKLAGALPEAIAAHIHRTIHSLDYRPGNLNYARVLEVILTGWATGRKVKIWHRAGDSEHVHDYIFSPYFLEPSGVGYATYAIGYSSWFEGIHTYKLERIQRAELTEETFEIPAEFDGAALLHNAWMVMFGPAGEETEVVLRFSPQVARRVRESIWHPSQVLEECEDGGCILRMRLAYPVEAKWWIRAWGPDCVVVSPEGLRADIAEEIQRAAENYQ